MKSRKSGLRYDSSISMNLTGKENVLRVQITTIEITFDDEGQSHFNYLPRHLKISREHLRIMKCLL